MLSDREQLVLSYCEYRPQAEAPEVARALGLKVGTVQSLLRKLRARWPEYRKALVNPMALGELRFSFYFSLSTQNQKEQQKVLTYLASLPCIVWLGRLVGDFQYGSVMTARRLTDIQEVLQQVTRNFGEVFCSKYLSPRVRFIKYPRKYLGKSAKAAPTLELVEGEHHLSLDEEDSRILEILAPGNVSSEREIARRASLPFSTVERRITRLERAKVIVGYYWNIQAADLQRESYQLLVECSGTSETLTANVRAFCHEHAFEIYLSECLGTCEFEIGVDVQNVRDVRALVDELYHLLGTRLRRVTVLGGIEDLKLLHFSRVPRFRAKT